MDNKIDISTMLLMKSISNKGNTSCKCTSGGSGFNIALSSLMNALSKKEMENQFKEANKTNGGIVDIIKDNILNLNNKVDNIEITAKDESTKGRIENAIEKSSNKYGVDKKLIKAIIKVESNFNPNVVSSAGAKGLMQLMPENCKDLGVKDPFNIEENIDGGTRHIKEYLDMYNGNVEMALMAYNGGPTRMRNRGVVSPKDIYKMPTETQKYVPKVMKIYRG